MTWRRCTSRLAAPAVLLAALLAPAPAATTEPDAVSAARELVEARIGPLATAEFPGGVAAAVHIDGQTVFFNYGFADQAERRPVTSATLFNVGSLRKVFEAALVALGTLRGELSLDDPVNKYVTELRGDYVGRITIGQLAAHTSGLLMPTDHPPWPKGSYSLAQFIDALNAFRPQAGEEPGKQRIYTHAGYLLLQVALERRYGRSINELLESRIFQPLGMRSTLIPERGPGDRAVLPAELMRRVVQGYSWDGTPVGPPGNQQSYYDFPGSGQMFSSASDLAIFVAACLDGTAADPQLRDALRMTQREMFRVGEQFGQAMAWETVDLDGVNIVDKPGGLNNASAYVGLLPVRKAGVVLLANRADFPYEVGRYEMLPALSRVVLAPARRFIRRRRRFAGRISQDPSGLGPRGDRQRGPIGVAGGQDVKHRLACRDQIVRDDPAVTAPPHRFRAHDRAGLRVTELAQPAQPGAERLAHGVVRIMVKAGVLPERIGLRRHVAAVSTQAPERGDVRIADAGLRQCLGQDIAVVLRVGPRTRHGSHVGDEPHGIVAQQLREFRHRAGRMADCEEGGRHGRARGF
jgi:beta-lactamase class C